MIADRRDFHRYAEAGWTEFRTASLIARRLTSLGYQVRVGEDVCVPAGRFGVPAPEVLEAEWHRAQDQGGDPEFLAPMRGGFTGVVGVLKRGNGPTVALRFDIDALGIEESRDPRHRPFREGFASINKGICHACGHDGHAATGLGVARVLRDRGTDRAGTVKLVFQPAEEGVRGAASMVLAGHLDDVDVLLGYHVLTERHVGEIAPGMGGYAATRKFDYVFHGAAAHAGGVPEGGKNALLAAATAAVHLHALPRHRAGFTRVNVGRLEAGTGRNVIPEHARMAAEVRGETTKLCDEMALRAEEVVHAAAQMYGCSCTVIPMGHAGTAESSPELVAAVSSVARALGIRIMHDLPPAGGSEDFTEMMHRVQARGGMAANIGVGADLRADGREASHCPDSLAAHSGTFDFDERAMTVAAKLLSALTIANLA